jgi:hypothetical protein
VSVRRVGAERAVPLQNPARFTTPDGQHLEHLRLATRPIDARTVEVTVTPPARLTAGRDYWLFVEIDWRDGNTDYYPREKLTGHQRTLVVDIPPDATLDAERAGRVYALTPAQSAATDDRVERQQTTKVDDFFANPPGAAASGSIALPFSQRCTVSSTGQG